MHDARDALESPPALLDQRRQRLPHPLAILIIIVFTTPLLLTYLGSGDPTDMMELFNLVPAREAYRDGHWFMPTLDGMPRFEKPPLAAWIPAAFATVLRGDSLWVLRLPSLLLGVLTALATYGIGCRLFGQAQEEAARARAYALLAALLLPTLHLFNHEARLASYDIYAAAFTTACVLCVLGLVDAAGAPPPGPGRPWGAGAWRWWLWTLLGGAALGLALLSKGPAPPATVLLPLAVWVAVFHRSRALLGAGAMMLLISLIVAVPWGLAIFLWYPEARVVWAREVVKLTTARRGVNYQVDQALRDPWYYYAQMFIWVTPLSPTFIAGLVMPFLPSRSRPAPSTRERQGRWLLWMIVIGGLLLLSLPAEKKLRYSLQLAPFVSLLCAAVWQEFIRIDGQAKVETPTGIIQWAQALCFIVPGIAGIAAALWVGATGGLFRWPQAAAAIHAFGLVPAVTLGAALLALGLWHLRLQYRRRFAWAAGTLAASAWLLMMIVQGAVRSVPATMTDPARAPAEAAVAQAGAQPIYTFHDEHPWIHTLFFANRPLTETTPQALAERARRNPGDTFYLMIVTANKDGIIGHDQPIPEVQRFLTDVHAQSGRAPEPLLEWLDEHRHTVLFRIPPPPLSHGGG